MQFELGLVFFSLLFVALFILGLFLVFRRSWLIVWLRANTGIALLFVGLAGVAGLYQLTDMTSITGETRLGLVEVKPDAGGRIQVVRLDLSAHGDRDIELNYAQWRLSAMTVHWSGILSLFGIDDGMLLYDLQQSETQETLHSTALESRAVAKVWHLGQAWLNWLPGVQFKLVTTEWFPSDANTLYDLSVTNAGLRLKDRHQKVRPNTAQILFEKPAGSTDNAASENESNVKSQNQQKADVSSAEDSVHSSHINTDESSSQNLESGERQ